jgi:L-fuconolactonase
MTEEVADRVGSAVDAHLHYWDRRRFHYSWLDRVPDAPVAATPQRLADERAIARRAVFVQADCRAEEGLAEARWAGRLDDGDGVEAVVAFAQLERGAVVEEDLQRLLQIPVVAGVRRLLQDEPDDFLGSPELRAGLRAVGDHGLVFDACVRSRQLSSLVHVRRGAPGTRFVLDHLGKPPLREGIASDAGATWAKEIQALAREPDTYVKLSGLRPEADPDHPLAHQAAPFLVAALEAFGVERAMAGSDWPVSTYGCYDEWFDLLVDVLRPTAEEWAALSEGTAVAAYRLQQPEGHTWATSPD